MGSPHVAPWNVGGVAKPSPQAGCDSWAEARQGLLRHQTFSQLARLGLLITHDTQCLL